MEMRRVLGMTAIVLLAGASGVYGASEVADAAMKGNKEAVRALVQKKADVNATQVDGTTALHWAVQANDLATVDVLLKAGAKVSAANREGVTPLLLATQNGNAAMIEKLVKGGADPNASLTKDGDTSLMMASRSGKIDAVKVLLDNGAQVNTQERWGGTSALMWAVSEKHPAVAKLLIERGADVNAHSYFLPASHGRGFEGTLPESPQPGQTAQEFASGLLTPLMFAARENDLESAKLLIAAKADINATGGDGKDALGLALFNGAYDVASLLLDSHAAVNHADAQGFTPLYWAVDRRDMETAPNFPWMVTTDPLPLIRRLLDAGANVNAIVNNTPRARIREGTPRLIYATSLMRAAWSGDLELVKLLLDHGADPHIVSKDNETTIEAAVGEGLILGYHKMRPEAERLEVVKLLVSLGEDVNAADNYGITPLMIAGNMGQISIIKYLIDVGADLAAHDLGKKNDGSFGSSIEPLMPIDYAIGVGTFVPNNSITMHEDAVKVMQAEMDKRGIKHITSECTLRGFTCSTARVDPKTATPAEIARARKIQTGNQVDGITGGLGGDPDKDKDKDKEKAKTEK